MDNELYRANISTKDGYINVEGSLVAAENDGKFYMIGNATNDNLIKLIYGSVFYATKTFYDIEEISALRAMDKCILCTERVIRMLEETLKQDEIELGYIDKDTHDVDAIFAVGVNEQDFDVGGYNVKNSTVEHFVMSAIYTSSLELIKNGGTNIDDITNIIGLGIKAFKEKCQPKEEQDDNVIVTTIEPGKRQEINGKIAFLVSRNGAVIVGERYKYNLAELGERSFAAVGSVYVDEGVGIEKTEKALEQMYKNALKIVRDRAKNKLENDKNYPNY